MYVWDYRVHCRQNTGLDVGLKSTPSMQWQIPVKKPQQRTILWKETWSLCKNQPVTKLLRTIDEITTSYLMSCDSPFSLHLTWNPSAPPIPLASTSFLKWKLHVDSTKDVIAVMEVSKTWNSNGRVRLLLTYGHYIVATVAVIVGFFAMAYPINDNKCSILIIICGGSNHRL